MNNNYVLSPYKLLLCFVINYTKSSMEMLSYLEKYVTHATINCTKLDELSFKNFKIAIKRDIAKETKYPYQRQEQHKIMFDNILRKIKALDMGKLYWLFSQAQVGNLERYRSTFEPQPFRCNFYSHTT